MELRSEIRKVSIYLPKELRSILIVFQVSLDQEFINIKNLSLVSGKKISELEVLKIIGKNASIYQTYIDCFYKLIEKYIVIGYGEKDYLSILREHNLDEDGQFISQTKHEDFCSLYILSVKRRNLEAQQELLHRILDHR